MNLIGKIALGVVITLLISALVASAWVHGWVQGSNSAFEIMIEVVEEKEITQQYHSGGCIEETQQGEWILCQ